MAPCRSWSAVLHRSLAAVEATSVAIPLAKDPPCGLGATVLAERHDRGVGTRKCDNVATHIVNYLRNRSSHVHEISQKLLLARHPAACIPSKSKCEFDVTFVNCHVCTSNGELQTKSFGIKRNLFGPTVCFNSAMHHAALFSESSMQLASKTKSAALWPLYKAAENIGCCKMWRQIPPLSQEVDALHRTHIERCPKGRLTSLWKFEHEQYMSNTTPFGPPGSNHLGGLGRMGLRWNIKHG